MSSVSVTAKPDRSSTSDENRRRSILAELDIDVWQARTGAAATVLERSDLNQSETGASSLADPTELPGGQAARGHSGPAAAMALLADAQSQTANPVAGRSAVAKPPADAESSPISAATPELSQQTAGQPSEPAVDLWCLSGPHGVLLANFIGLSPAGQRLLNDVFQAAMRMAAGGGDKKKDKLKLQQLRFTWPPADGGVALGNEASTARALRGFLNRQLKSKENALILYTNDDLRALLADIELNVESARMLLIGEPDALVGNGAAKRALWQTLTGL